MSDHVDLSVPCRLAGKVTAQGYGTARTENHRHVWVARFGPVEKGLDVNHLCHDADASCKGGVTCPHRRCYEIRHLGLATRSSNVRSGNHMSDEERSAVILRGWETKKADPVALAARNAAVASGVAASWERERDGGPYVCGACGFEAATQRSVNAHYALKSRVNADGLHPKREATPA